MDTGCSCCHCCSRKRRQLLQQQQLLLSAAAAFPSNALQVFSTAVRAHREIVLAFCTRNGLNLQFASLELRRDVSVVQTACRSNPLAILYYDYSNNNGDDTDRDKNNKKNLTANKEFMLSLFQRCCPCTTTNRTVSLLVDTTTKKINKNRDGSYDSNDDTDGKISATVSNNKNHSVEQIWSLCSPSLQSDRSICMAAMQAGISPTSSLSTPIPSHFLEDVSFWQEVLQVCPALWYDLPLPLMNQEMAKMVMLHIRNVPLADANSVETKEQENDRPVEPQQPQQQFFDYILSDNKKVSCRDLMSDLFLQYPGLLLDRDCILFLARHYSDFLTDDLLTCDGLIAAWWGNDTGWIHSDKEIILLACRNNGHKMLTKMSATYWTLVEDRDVLSTALTSSPASLVVLPNYVQAEFPDLMAAAIRRLNRNQLPTIVDQLTPSLWSDRGVVLAWIETGGPYLEDAFPSELENDEEIMLALAEHSPEEFWHASERLRAHKGFMLKAVEKHGELLMDCEDLHGDFDLELIAYANKDDLPMLLCETSFETVVDFATELRRRLDVYNGFVEQFLCGIMIIPADKGIRDNVRDTTGAGCEEADDSKQQSGTKVGVCHLPMLNQGNETTTNWKKLVAEYADIPRGKELNLLRKASENLIRWGF